MLTGITGVNNNSLLLSSSNSSLSSGEIRLSNFTNKFTEGEFDKYFEYDGTSGNLICKQAGWYFIDLQLLIQDSREEYAQTILECMINNSLTTRVQGLVWTAEKQKRASDDNAFSIYLKEKDTITIKKVTYNNLALYNQVTINLYKM